MKTKMITLIFQQKDWTAAASSKDTGTNLTVFDELGYTITALSVWTVKVVYIKANKTPALPADIVTTLTCSQTWHDSPVSDVLQLQSINQSCVLVVTTLNIYYYVESSLLTLNWFISRPLNIKHEHLLYPKYDINKTTLEYKISLNNGVCNVTKWLW